MGWAARGEGGRQNKQVYWCVSLRSVGRDMTVSMVTTRLFISNRKIGVEITSCKALVLKLFPVSDTTFN